MDKGRQLWQACTEGIVGASVGIFLIYFIAATVMAAGTLSLHYYDITNWLGLFRSLLVVVWMILFVYFSSD